MKSSLKKTVSFISAFALLFNSLAAPFSVLAQEATPTPTASTTLTASPEAQPTATQDATPAEIATPTSEITPTPSETPTPTATPLASPEPTVEAGTPSPSPWTFENVELNKEYQNGGVTLTFTKLPTPAGNIKIEEITLTQEQIQQTGSLSDKAYDITSNMTDGSFSYNLSLPIPESSKGKSVEVKFSEELSNIGSAEKVDNTLTKTDTSVSVVDLDHMTVFVVVGWNFPDNPDDAIADEGVAMNSTKTISVTGAGGLEFNTAGSTTMSARAAGWDNGDGTKYWEIEFDATAFSSLKLYSKQRSSTTGPRDFKIQYKLGSGGTWTDFGPAGIVVADNWISGVLSDIAFPAEVNNQPSVFVRWLMNSNIAVGGSPVGSAGASNIDDIRVEGNATTINVPAHYLTIQAAINAASEGDTINVAAGTYVENVNVTKDLTLQGVAGTNLQGQITISHDSVTIDNFDITNPNVGYGIVSTDYSNLTITNNTFHNIGTSLSSGSVQVIDIISNLVDVSNITISGNTISNIGNLTLVFSGSGSAKGIYLGNSNGTKIISNVTINNNNISSVFASTAAWNAGRGAYGILVNHKTTGLQVTNNTIGTLEGLWAHAIGLEGDTPTAVLNNNTISGLISHKTPIDAFAVYFESNTSKNTVSLNGVVLGDISTVMVDDDWAGYDNNPVVSVSGHDYIFGVNAFATIQDGITAVASDGTVNVAAGTYTEVGQIVIDKNLSIVGADKATTIIKPAQNTVNTSGSDARGWFLIGTQSQPDVTFNLSNVTLDGTGHLIYMGLYYWGNGTVNNCNITNIKYNESGPDYQGRGMIIKGNVDVTNSTFSQIGRIGIQYYMGNGTVSGNTYTGKGNDNWLDYAVEVDMGSHVIIDNNTISNNKGIATSDGSDSSGISVWDDAGTQATITNNTLTNNHIGVAVAVINGEGTDPVVTIGDGNIFNGGDIGVDLESLYSAVGSPTITFGISTFKAVTTAINIMNGISFGETIDIRNVIFKDSSDVVITDSPTIESLVYHLTDATNRGLLKWDYVAPTVPENGLPNGTYVATNDFDFTWNTSSDVSSVTYEYQASLNSAEESGVLTTGLWHSGTLSSNTIHSSGASDGTWYWQVRALDNYENTSAWSAIWNVTKDTIAPTDLVATPVAGDYTSDQSVTLSSSDTNGYAIYYTTDGTTPNSSSLTTTPIVVNKDMTIKAVAIDPAGNVSDMLSATYGIAPVISGETSSSVSETTATITWTTDDLSTSRVVYDTVSHEPKGAASNYGYANSTIEDSTKVTSHSVGLSGLTAGTTYYYRTISHGSPDAVSDEQTFATPNHDVCANINGSQSSVPDGMHLDASGLNCVNFSQSGPAPRSDEGNSNGQVLGINTSTLFKTWPKLAYAGNASIEENVLGTETEATIPSTTTTPEASFTSTPQPEKVGAMKWILTHKKISGGIALILLAVTYGFYRASRKNK